MLRLGIDVGGTKTAVGLFEGSELIATDTFPTLVSAGSGHFVEHLELSLEQMLKGKQASHIGIALPELISLNHQVRSQWIWDWSELNLESRLSHLGPIRFESDVIAAAIGEAQYGGHGFASFVYVSAGTGLSSCLMLGSKPYRGARGFAIHCGHKPLQIPTPDFSQTLEVTVEEVSSGSGILACAGRLKPGGYSSTQDVFAAMRNGDSVATRVIHGAANLLGSLIGQLVNTLDPHAVVIGGGMSRVEEYFELVSATARQSIWSPEQAGLPIVQASLAPHSGIYGAAHKE